MIFGQKFHKTARVYSPAPSHAPLPTCPAQLVSCSQLTVAAAALAFFRWLNPALFRPQNASKANHFIHFREDLFSCMATTLQQHTLLRILLPNLDEKMCYILFHCILNRNEECFMLMMSYEIILQVNIYEIVVNFFRISHNLT